MKQFLACNALSVSQIPVIKTNENDRVLQQQTVCVHEATQRPVAQQAAFVKNEKSLSLLSSRLLNKDINL